MPFKLSNLNSNLALTPGYLNPALNNRALNFISFHLSQKQHTRQEEETKSGTPARLHHGELSLIRGTQREYSSKTLKYSIVKRILVFKRLDIGIFLFPKNFSSVRIS